MFNPSVNMYFSASPTINDTACIYDQKRDTLFQYQGTLGVYQEVQIEALGSGSYGEVRLVQNITTQIYYAMKKMSRQVLKQIQAEDNINLEILIQSKLNHPNILKLVEVFSDYQNLYIILEYCSNGTLMQIIKTKGPFSETEAFFFFEQILSGIEYLHTNNIIHRDIKPENILISDKNIVKICDFNWAIQVDQMAKPVLCGTTEYMPPEVVTNQPHDFKVDVWSLGILLYQMLHCDTPYKGRNNMEKISSILANLEFPMNDQLSQDVQILIYAMLSRPLNCRPTIRQIFFSKWFKQQTRQIKILNPYNNNTPVENQLPKSENISMIKDVYAQDVQKSSSDVQPAKLNVYLPQTQLIYAPIKIWANGNLVEFAAPKH